MPRGKALIPLLAGCSLMTSGQGIEIGPISLPIYRMLILIGIFRVLIKGETLIGGLGGVDKLVVAWAAWYLFSSLFHDSSIGFGPVYVCGVIYNLLGFYFLVRIWCSGIDDVTDLIKPLAYILLIVAVEMLFEQVSGKNLFSIFGRVPEDVLIREGRYRAQASFMHPILAGTVGATCVPFFIGILKRARASALVGISAGICMTFASASSGPVMSLISVCAALAAWNIRQYMHLLRITALVAYLLLIVAMEKPPYYLISRIDISGGSTGWHRSFLIEQTIRYLPEWWLFGTDYTRHWMPDQGVAMSPTHTDITNYYIGFGVGGGLLAMILIILIFYKSMRLAGSISFRMGQAGRKDDEFMVWCFAAAMFSHSVTSISVAYFDQSSAFLWLTVALISSMRDVSGSSAESDCHKQNNFCAEDDEFQELANRIR
jgi:hypothetical protein